ncbi:Mce-associated membrane protein [Mycolicibacterium rutilum]|uniref:Mce-associated membrane protein n=1 Tax=Mycolicibacterium rutilum TaxID=370526 RepID=A0A1H6K7I6_MYCRU|nr:Mce protein [Mycolicibacterium rutilum]SEH68415.1 Mce-associated membrane protein [Mycolicibacterium rutilum]
MADEETPAEGEESTAQVGDPDPQDKEAEAEATEAVEDYDSAEDAAEEAAPKPRMSHVKLATIAGLVLVLVLGGLTGWLGYRAYESRQAEDVRNLFLQVGRQGALNLTTINHEQAEADVQRVLDSSTGTFYDDFQQRSAPFIEVVKQAQSKSEGKISEAGLESSNDNEGQVLVAVTVNTTNAGAPEQQPRSWRMRISVQKTGDDEAKVSNVEFVP